MAPASARKSIRRSISPGRGRRGQHAAQARRRAAIEAGRGARVRSGYAGYTRRVALSGKRILITGGAGLHRDDARAAARRRQRGDRVRQPPSRRPLRHRPRRPPELPLPCRATCSTCRASTEAARGVTHIVHAAGIAGVDTVLASPVRTMRVNMIGTYNALEAALATQDTLERMVEFSTSEVFGQHAFNVGEGQVTTIGSVGEARWTYAVSKLAGEHMSHAYHAEFGLPTVSVRPFNIFGPGQIGGGAIRAFIEAALDGRDLTIHGDGSQIRAWCYVDDMVHGTLLGLEHPNAVGESFNIGNARSAVTIYDLARRIKRITGAPGEIVFTPLDYVDVELRIPNMGKARELLGFEAHRRARRRPRAHDRLVPREPSRGFVSEPDPPRAPRRRRGRARRRRRGRRDGDADDGPEGRRARARARRRLRHGRRGRRLVGHGRAPSRDDGARDRSRRRGDRPRLHVPGDRERGRALRRARGARRRRPRHVQPRSRPRRRGGHRADEGGARRPSLRPPGRVGGAADGGAAGGRARRGRRRSARRALPRHARAARSA